MKIVQINAVYKYSSTGRTTMELHHALLNAGHESYVFCRKDDQYEPWISYKCYSGTDRQVYLIGNKLDHKIHALVSRITGFQGYHSKSATRMLVRRLSECKPDVVHLRNLHESFIHLPMLLEYLAREDIATVVTLHDCWFFTGNCCYYTKCKCNKWQQQCGACPELNKMSNWLYDPAKKIFLDKKMLFESIPRLAVIGNSEWTTEQARQSFLKNASIIKRIYNWIDLESFSPQETTAVRAKLGLTNQDKVLLGVAQRWTNKKGLGIFIALAQRLPQYKFLLIGHLPASVVIPANIITIPPINNITTLAEFYSLADVFINPSEEETFGKVSAEALACGTPLIVNNATANPELAGEGCGYIVDGNSMDAYIRYINLIISNGRSTYSSRCIQFAKENFEMDTNVKAYLDVYQQLISDNVRH